MSTAPETQTTAKAPRRRWFRIVVWTFASLFVLLIVALLGGWYYTTTADFQRRVGTEVVGVL